MTPASTPRPGERWRNLIGEEIEIVGVFRHCLIIRDHVTLRTLEWAAIFGWHKIV